MSETISTRESYGKTLAELGETNLNLVVLDADLSKSTYTSKFGEKFPERFFNIGIAEANMMSLAGGMALTGKIPFASTFAVFACGRAFDQIRNTICYPNLNVKIVATHAGISVGEDGGSHQSIEDIAIMRVLPNMQIISPCDGIQTKWAIETAIKNNGPFYIRLGRVAMPNIYNEDSNFEFGKASILKEGTDITIISTGLMTHYALEATNTLSDEGISVRLLDIHTIKPIDKQAILESATKTNKILTVEEHSTIGGLGEAVASVCSTNYPTKIKMIGVEDKFGTSGQWKEVLKEYNLTTENIIKTAKSLL